MTSSEGSAGHLREFAATLVPGLPVGAASTRHRLAYLVGSILLILFAIAVIRYEYLRTLPRAWLWDFGSFLESGRAAKAGLNPFGIYPLTFHVVLPGFEAWNPNLNPPISGLLFQAFDLAEPHRMFRIWYGISVALYAALVLIALQRYRDEGPLLVLAAWAFALAGFWDTLLLGQIYIPLALCAVGAWLLLERGEAVAAGILIGVVVALKPNFAVWPVLLFLSGHWRPAVAAGATTASLSLLPVLLFGPNIYAQWLELLAADGDRAFFLTNASLTGLASRVGHAGLGIAISAAMLVLSAAWALWRRPSVQRAGSLGLALSLLASPIAWVHYTLFILPVFLTNWRLTGVRLSALALIVPVPVVIAQFGKPAWIQASLGSVYNWALVVLLVALVAEEARLWRDSRAGRGSGQTTPYPSRLPQGAGTVPS